MHTLIIGRTESGKSAMAKNIGSDLRERGVFVAAYNPTGEPGYTRRDSFGCAGADIEFDNPDEFIEYIETIKYDGKVKYLIVDEAHEFFGKSDAQHLWLARKGRHYGINLIGCTQRGADIHATFRSQCSKVYVFKCSGIDAKFIADEFGDKHLRYACLSKEQGGLDQGEYYVCDIHGVVKRRLF